jgi:hypothetical protein
MIGLTNIEAIIVAEELLTNPRPASAAATNMRAL